MEEWDKRKAEAPESNRACVLEKVRTGFHVGVLVYRGSDLVAWVAIGPLIDFYWTWKRVGQLGDCAKTVAAIPCITRSEPFRAQVREADILKALVTYAKEQDWTAVEGYPFNRETIDNSGAAVTWPGFPEDFIEAGFIRVADHWLNSPEYKRSIYRLEI